jgi:GAF domain-containing protein/HAMP domain-containing protein
MTQVETPSSPEHRFRGKFTRKLLILIIPVMLVPLTIAGIMVIFRPQAIEPGLLQIVLAASFLTGILISFLAWVIVSKQIVQPIKEINEIVQYYEEGNLENRTKIERDDEIGLLAHSINQTGIKLGSIYHSLEDEVVWLTKQLQTAAELAKVATTATNVDELLQGSIDLIIERFNYAHAAILLIESSGKQASLRATSGMDISEDATPRLTVKVEADTLPGWVLINNQPRVIPNMGEDPLSLPFPNLANVKSEAAIPISIAEKVLGVLDVQDNKLDAFSWEDITTLQTYTDQVAAAIRNMQILEEAQMNPEGGYNLSEASQLITDAETFEEVFEVLQNTFQTLSLPAALFKANQNEFHNLLVTDPDGRPAREAAFPAIPVAPWDLSWTIPKTYPIYNADTCEELPDYLRTICEQLGYHNPVLYPLFCDSKMAGLLFLGSDEKKSRSTLLLENITNLIKITNTSLEKIQALRTVRNRLDELETLNTVSQSISTEVNLDDLYEVIHQQVIKVMGEVNFLIALYSRAKGTIEIPYMDDGDEIVSVPPFPLGQGLTSIIIRTRQPLMIVEDTINRSRALGAIVTGDKPALSWLGVPIIAGDEILGAIVVQDLEQENRFDEEDMHILTTFASQVAIAVRNSRLIKSVQERAERDQKLYAITNKIWQSTDIQSVMATTAQELTKALNLRRTQIEISLGPGAEVIRGNGHHQREEVLE